MDRYLIDDRVMLHIGREQAARSFLLEAVFDLSQRDHARLVEQLLRLRLGRLGLNWPEI